MEQFFLINYLIKYNNITVNKNKKINKVIV